MNHLILPDEMKANIEIYENIVFDLSNLFCALGIKSNPIKIAETFYYMYMNKYLSSYSYFESECPPSFVRLEEIGYIPSDVTGTVILAGYGVCRHKADFLNHLFNSLGYLSSQLFVYVPDVKTEVINNRNKPISNYEAQEYIDKTIEDLDVFSLHDISCEKQYDDILVKVNYHTSTYIMNHTINIVKKLENDIICILDSAFHYIGESIGDRQIKMADINNPGFVYNYYVRNYPRLATYYPSRYGLGFNLWRDFDTSKLETSLMEALVYYEKLNEFIPEFENFRNNHGEKYQEVQANYRTLTKKYL